MQPRYGISSMTLPPEGPRAIRQLLDFVTNNTAAGVDIDLSESVPDNMSFVQGIFVDNYDNNVVLECRVLNGTQQRLIVPANAQVYLPILCDNPPQFNFRGKTGIPGIVIPVYFYNMPIPPCVIK